MSTDKAIVSLSIGDFSIRVEGSEEFVEEQVSDFHETVLEHLKKQDYQSTGEGTTSSDEGVPSGVREPSSIENYPSLYHSDGDEVNLLLRQIPGDSTAEKTRNVARLYLFGKNLLGGEPVVDKKKIVEICEEYGFHDSGNFKSNIESGKPYLIIEGEGKDYNIRLTPPGIDSTEKIIQSEDESS
jgi:hypothetical protein